jgi:hypothetical protein
MVGEVAIIQNAAITTMDNVAALAIGAGEVPAGPREEAVTLYAFYPSIICSNC